MATFTLADVPRPPTSERLRKSRSDASACAPWMLLAILGLALALRCIGLGSESLWLDEATSLILAQNPPAQLIALTAEDIHPPLYYLLLRAWLVFGQSEAALRSLSVVAGVLTVLALYDVGRQLFGRGVGLLAALLLAVSPLHVWYAQEARMYALVTLWGVASTALMLRALRGGRWPVWAGYSLTAAFGMYTHYYMGFVILAQNVVVLFLWLRGMGGMGAICSQRTSVRLGPWVAAQAGWILLFALWIPTVIQQVSGGGGGWIEDAVGRPGLRALGDVFIAYVLGTLRGQFPDWLRRGAYMIYGVVALAGVWGIVRLARCKRVSERPWSVADATWVTIFLCLLPLSVTWSLAQAKPIFALRYTLPFLPAFCLLLAAGACRLARWRKGLGVAFAALLLIPAGWGVWQQAVTLEKEDWRGLTAQLISAAGADAVVLPEPFWNAKPLHYYAGERLVIDDGAPLPATPDSVQAAVLRVVEDGRTVWLLENAGHYGDPNRLLAGYLFEHCERQLEYTYPGIGVVAKFSCDRQGLNE